MEKNTVPHVANTSRRAASAILMGFKLHMAFSYCCTCNTDTPLHNGACNVCGTSHAQSLAHPVQHPEPELN